MDPLEIGCAELVGAVAGVGTELSSGSIVVTTGLGATGFDVRAASSKVCVLPPRLGSCGAVLLSDLGAPGCSAEVSFLICMLIC